MLSPGQLVEGTPYRVLRELGAGGMGVVYEVEHVRLAKRYVAKVLKSSFQGAGDALARIEREGRVLAELNHPNIVQIHDVGVTPLGVHYLVMERLDGCDLRVRMTAGPRIAVAEALGIVASVLDALAYVHARGIVHRDIKPGNIFLAEGPTGTVTKVLDFGIAHVATGANALTKTGAFLGTLEYASPEQMHGLPPGPATDVYAAALVLFELVAGQSPFAGDPGVGVVRCFKPAPTLVDVAHASPRLSEIVARALSIDPAVRPGASELAAALHALHSAPERLVREPTTDSVSVDELLGNLGGPRPVPAEGREQRVARSSSGTGPSVPPPIGPSLPPRAGAWGMPGAVSQANPLANGGSPWAGTGAERIVTGGGVSATVPQTSRASARIAVGAIVGMAVLAVVTLGGALHHRRASMAATAGVAASASATQPAAVPGREEAVASGSANPPSIASTATATSTASTASTAAATPSSARPMVSDAGVPAKSGTGAVARPFTPARPARPAAEPSAAPAGGYITTLPPP